MKKIFAIALAATLSLTLLAGCNGGTTKENTAPTLSGVKETATVMAGETFDALAGVTASDKEDGNLTSKIVVSSDELTFTDGKTTPTMVNDTMGYYITYSVKDSGGKEAAAHTTLYVTEKVSELENIFTADFSQAPTAADSDKHGWNAWIDKDAGIDATAEVKDGAYVIDVKDMPATVDNDGALNLNKTVNDLGVGQYKFIVWAKASVETYYCQFAKDAKKDGWVTYGNGTYHQKIGTEWKAYAIDFELTEGDLSSVDGKTNIEFHFNLGRKQDGSADMPNAFTVSVNKIAIYTTTGKETETEQFKKESFEDNGGLEITNHGDDASVTAGYDATEQAAKIDIATYNNTTTGGLWSISAVIPLTGATIEAGGHYGYEIVVKATHAITKSEVILAPKGNKETDNKNHNYNIAIGEEDTTLKFDFVAGGEIADPGIHFQLGKDRDTNTPDATSNAVLIKSVRLYKIEGNKTTNKDVSKFVLFGKGTANEANVKFPFDVTNGSDDDVANKGIGTAYIKDGKLVYEIYEGSTVAGQNKLVIGYWENPINLPANAKYVVSFKVKASASIGMDVCLHDMDCGPNWDDGLIFRRASWLEGVGNYKIGTTETTVEFTTDAVYKASKCELILEFGSTELAALTGGVIIEISEIKIGVQRLAD